MRALATAFASVVMALAAFGLAVASPYAGRRDEPRAALAASSGAVRIANSREGQAVFTAAGIRPGEGVSGTLRIGNDGDVPGRFSVARSGMQDTPGPYGGRLSEQVLLELLDVTDAQQPATVYTGTPAGFGDTDLGTLAPGAYRDYVISATLPNGGLPLAPDSGDNRFQGSALSLGLEWRATSADVLPSPTQTSDPAPAPVPGGTPGPLPPAPPAAGGVEPAGEALADAIGLPPAKSCVKRRRLRLRLKTPDRARVVSATIAINRKVKKRVSGAKARRPVKLRRLPKRRFTLGITVRAANGRTYTATRSYRACARKKNVRSRIRLRQS
jgi:hypothetical protein